MLLSLFGRKDKDKTNEQDNNPVSPPSLPRAVAFVDYESWYVSLKTTYAIAPDIKGWFEELNRRYQLIDVTFFADFSHRSLADELRRIRPYTNKIIDTRSPNGVEKDYTDFIMLDNIYQKALSASDIQTFILFSGDGHFSSVVAFLKSFYHKNVVVYGIQDCFSAQLREAASEAITLPDEKQLNRGIYQTIFDYLRRAAVPTYDGAMQWVADKHKSVSRKTVQNAMDLLEKREVLSQRALPGSKGKQLFISWESAEEWLDVPLAEYLAQPVEPIRQYGRNERTEGRRPDESNRRPEHGDQPHFKLKDAHAAPDRQQKPSEASPKPKADERKQASPEQKAQTPAQASSAKKAEKQPQQQPKQQQPKQQQAKPAKPDPKPEPKGSGSEPEKAEQPAPKLASPAEPKAEETPKKQNGGTRRKKTSATAKQPASEPKAEKPEAAPEQAAQPKPAEAEQPKQKPLQKKKKLKPKPEQPATATATATAAAAAPEPADTPSEPEKTAKDTPKPAEKQPQKPKKQQSRPQPSKAKPKPEAEKAEQAEKAEPEIPKSGEQADKPKPSGRRRRRSGSKPKADSSAENPDKPKREPNG